MSIIVFAGPSLPPAARPQTAGLIFRGPARQGDVYRALGTGPRAIAIIDGFFDAVPSVWHKEILWAMAEGVHVLGSASMGALRAAELDSFGMEGVGAVYEAFRDGVLEDDDEVAVIHGPAELGHRPLSSAMVNIRATVRDVDPASLRDPASAEGVERAAKALGYWDRTPAKIEAAAIDRGTERGDAATIAHRIAADPVDVKRQDAELLVSRLTGDTEAFGQPKDVRYTFNETVAWRNFVAWAEAQPND